jgi:hypothetical protein
MTTKLKHLALLVMMLAPIVACQGEQAAWLVGIGFTGVQSVYYWSSSSSADSTSDAWGVDMGDGVIDGDDKSYSQYVWPVRSGQ